MSCDITFSCKHWHDQAWILWITCESIVSYAKNNRVKLKPLRLADTSPNDPLWVIASSCRHWHDQLWMLEIVCKSILSCAKNNQVKLKPLRLADTSYHACVLFNSRTELMTALISCGSNVVLKSIANNDDKQNNTTSQTLPQKVSSNPSQASLGWVGLIN